MAGNELKIIIGADGKPLQKTLSQLEADLKAFNSRLKTTFDPQALSLLNNSIADTKKNIATLKTVGTNTFAGLKPGANEAAFALQNVGRVAQDLPFGFMGIQNNLNPLLESFQRLKASTGSTKTALQAMGSSLMGAGGLGFALSAVSSAILIYQNGIMNFGRKTKEAKDETEEFIKSLRDVKGASEESASGVSGQIATVQALSRAILDTNKSYEERSNALKSLKAVNKAYFDDIKLEADSLSGLTGKVNEYTQALIQQAIIKEFESEIGRIAKGLVDQNKELGKLRTASDRADAALEKFVSTHKLSSEAAKAGAGSALLLNNEYTRLVGAAAKANKAFEAQRTVVEDAYTNMAEFNGELQKAVDAQLKLKPLSADPEKKKKETDALKEQISTLEKLRGEVGLLKVEEAKLTGLKIDLLNRDGRKEGLDAGQIERLINSLRRELELKMAASFDVPIGVSPRIKIDVSGTLGAALPEGFNQPIIDQLQTAGQKAAEGYAEGFSKAAATSMAETISRGVGDAFASIAENLGNALSGNGGVAEAAEGFLSTIGSILQEVGKKVIMASALIMKLKTALTAAFSAGPAGALASIGVGMALVGAGAALKNIKISGARRLADGAILNKPTFVAGEAGTEVVAPLNKLKDFIGDTAQSIFITGHIEDRVIRLAVANAERRQRRMF